MNGTITATTIWVVKCGWCGWGNPYPSKETAEFVLRAHEQNCWAKP